MQTQALLCIARWEKERGKCGVKGGRSALTGRRLKKGFTLFTDVRKERAGPCCTKKQGPPDSEAP